MKSASLALETSLLPIVRRRSTQCLFKARRSPIRPFSITLTRETKLRDDMFRWLKNEGNALKNVSSNGPRYIGEELQESRPSRKADEEAEEDENTSEGEDASAGGVKEETSRRKKGNLHPFPSNTRFKSESVLSEELKDHIWHQITVEKQTIRRVSADLQVDMRRVGAVVRLKSLEKEWEKEVS